MRAIISVLVVSAGYLVWCLFRHLTTKSSLSNVAGPPRKSWFMGNFEQLYDRNGWNFHRDLIRKYGGAVKVHGPFGKEQLYVIDPLAVRHIVLKDQDIYEETDMFIQSNKLFLGPSLVSTLGEQHRKQRRLLNPLFAPKHLRGLVPIFYPIAHHLCSVIRQKVTSSPNADINMHEWMSRAALEYIGQGGLGYSFDSLDETKTNEYSDATGMLAPVAFRLAFIRFLIPTLVNIGTPYMRRKVLEWMPSKLLQQIRVIADTMDHQSQLIFRRKKDAVEKGDDALLNEIGEGKDMISIMRKSTFVTIPSYTRFLPRYFAIVKANMDRKAEDRLDDAEVLGQMSLFILAGHDTSTNALCRVFHQLVQFPEWQSKLREEVTAARNENGDLDYETLMALPILDAVCRETLRMFSPTPIGSRTTRRDAVLPLMWPVKAADGKSELKEIAVKKNTNIMVSVMGMNQSKAVYGEDAEEWKPERWLKPLPESVANAQIPGVYSSMMTFLGGDRACIGFKFAELEIKLVVSVLLESFEFSMGSKEIVWDLGNITTPTTKGATGFAPQLPLRIELVKR